MRNEGLAVIERLDPYRIESPNVETVAREKYEGGVLTRFEWIRTPLGELTNKKRRLPGYQTTRGAGPMVNWWEVEYPIKSLDDYRVMEFVVRDQVFVPEYDALRSAQADLGDDGFVIANVARVPMHRLMYDFLGPEQFAYDLLDHPDALLSLHEAMRRKDEEMFRVAVEAPVEMFIGPARNLDARMIGRDLYEAHCLRHIDAFADLAHEERKLSGSHFDGEIGFMRGQIAISHLDVVEAFTPGAISGMTMTDAFLAWPQKVVWANFPSPVHIESSDAVREETHQILGQVRSQDRFLLGITEDVPADAWRASFLAISQAVGADAR